MLVIIDKGRYYEEMITQRFDGKKFTISANLDS